MSAALSRRCCHPAESRLALSELADRSEKANNELHGSECGGVHRWVSSADNDTVECQPTCRHCRHNMLLLSYDMYDDKMYRELIVLAFL